MATLSEIYNGTTDWLSTTFTYENCEWFLGNYAEKVDNASTRLAHRLGADTSQDFGLIHGLKMDFITKNASDATNLKIKIVAITSFFSYVSFIHWMAPPTTLYTAIITILSGAFAYGAVCKAWEQAQPLMLANAARQHRPETAHRNHTCESAEEREMREAIRLSLQEANEGGGAPGPIRQDARYS